MRFELSKEEQKVVDAERNKLRSEFMCGFNNFSPEAGMSYPAPTNRLEEAYHKGEVAAEKVITRAREMARYDFYGDDWHYTDKNRRPGQRGIYTASHLQEWAITYGLNYNLHFDMYCDRYDEAYYNELRVLSGLKAK